MTHGNILDRLRIDPGQRTLGELLQDREAAAHEIRKLRADIERLRATRTRERSEKDDNEEQPTSPVMRAGMLVRLTEVCELIGVSRSTVYKWVAAGRFPAPVRVSERAIRWRVDEIEAWRDAL